MRALTAPILLMLAACGNAPDATENNDETSVSPENTTAQPSPGTAIASNATPDASPAPDSVVASWEGGSLTYAELQDQVKNQLIQMEIEYLTNRHSTEKSTLEQLVIERLLETEAAARGLDGAEALMKIEVEDKTEAPTEAELEEFYNVVKRQLQNQPMELVRDRLVTELTRRKQAELAQAYILTLKDKYTTTIDLPYPDMPRIEVSIDDDPSIGPADAPITIVQFAEYQCPYCGKAGESLDRVMEEYEGKILMVYRDFPLSFHDRAVPAAVAANCAGTQDKYWEMHALLMSDQRSLEEADLLAHAQTLALDLDAWNTCREDPAQEAEVLADMEDGSKAGVTGTPAFFINGIMLSGAQPFEQFKEVIDRELGIE